MILCHCRNNLNRTLTCMRSRSTSTCVFCNYAECTFPRSPLRLVCLPPSSLLLNVWVSTPVWQFWGTSREEGPRRLLTASWYVCQPTNRNTLNAEKWMLKKMLTELKFVFSLSTCYQHRQVAWGLRLFLLFWRPQLTLQPVWFLWSATSQCAYLWWSVCRWYVMVRDQHTHTQSGFHCDYFTNPIPNPSSKPNIYTHIFNKKNPEPEGRVQRWKLLTYFSDK